MKHPTEYQLVIDQKRRNGQLHKGAGRKSLSTVCSSTDDDECQFKFLNG
jgi:hypothetical protein